MSEDLYDKHRENTENIIRQIRSRGNKRIGQIILAALDNELDLPKLVEDRDPSEMSDSEFEKYWKEKSRAEAARKAGIYDALWDMEADQLLKHLQNHAGKVESE